MSATEDIATLGIQVKSDSVAESNSRLDTLVTKADKAVTATQRLESSMLKLNKVKFDADTMSKSWEALGGKSDAMFDQMRTNALTSYTKIRLCSESTAADIIRAERLKNESIKQINEEQFGRQTTLLAKMKEHWVATTAAVTAAYMGISKVSGFVEDSAKLGARYETLGVVMEVVGKNAGYSKDQMIGFSTALQKQGISMIESRQTLTQMVQAHLDLAKATDLARIAQGAAIIADINSSEAFQRMIYGIQSGQVEILRTIGINVNFENSYAKVAKATHRTAESFSEAEKALIRMNAVAEAGKDTIDIYPAAMETAGKQMTSFTRYVQDFKVNFGTALLEGLSGSVAAATTAMKDMQEAIKDPETQNALSDLSMEVSKLVKDLAEDAPKAIRASAEALKDLMAIYEELPPGAVGAGTLGIAGAVIFGGPAGVCIAAVYELGVATKYLHEQMSWIPDMSFGAFLTQVKDLIHDLKEAANLVARLQEGSLYKGLRDFSGTAKGSSTYGASNIASGSIDREDLVASRRQSNAMFNAGLGSTSAPPASGGGGGSGKRGKTAAERAQEEIEAFDYANAQEEANKLRAIKEITTEQQVAIKNMEASRAQAKAAELADARKTMMEDFNNAEETYAFEIDLLEKRRDRYAELINDKTVADAWYAKKKKALDSELAKSSDDFIAGVQAGYTDLEDSLYSWGRAGADALATFQSASKTLASDSLFSFMKGDMDSFSDYWDSFCDSMLRSFTDSVAQMVSEWMAGQAAMAAGSAWGGVTSFFGSLFGSAKGNVFMNGSPIPFASGGLITRPTIFPMANGGLGLAGEAGTEAIMPLKRLNNGKLGVEASGQGVTVNVINNGSQAQAEVKQSKKGNGSLEIDVLIDDIVAGKIAKGKTRNALMTQTAGFRPNIVRR